MHGEIWPVAPELGKWGKKILKIAKSIQSKWFVFFSEQFYSDDGNKRHLYLAAVWWTAYHYFLADHLCSECVICSLLQKQVTILLLPSEFSQWMSAFKNFFCITLLHCHTFHTDYYSFKISWKVTGIVQLK